MAMGTFWDRDKVLIFCSCSFIGGVLFILLIRDRLVTRMWVTMSSMVA